MSNESIISGPKVMLRQRRVAWPRDFDQKLVGLWERSRKEDPKTPGACEDFIMGLVAAGMVMLEQSLDAKKRETSLIKPALVMPKIEGQYVGRR
jgi:hypothetical protein